MDIATLRQEIDRLDLRLVELLNQRARAAQQIGRLKRNTLMPIYEPDREKVIMENVSAATRGPLSAAQMQYIFAHIIDMMRQLQKDEILNQ